MNPQFSAQKSHTLQGHSAGIVPPPPPVSRPKNTLWQDIQQGFEYVRFVWHISARIRGLRNRLRFLVGLILWKPILPKDEME